MFNAGTRSSLFSVAFASFLALTSLLLLAGCGGGSSTTPPQQTTTASLSATTATFAGVTTGSSSGPATVTLTNTGTNPLSVSSAAITGTNGSDFSQTNNCANVAAGASCTVTITFKPGATGSRSATLTLADNATTSPQTIPLGGYGTASSSTALPLGVALGTPVNCSDIRATAGEPNATCYTIAISSCPNTADTVAWMKVNNPTGTKGTVSFMVGGGGIPFYDQNFNYGTNEIDMVQSAGFTTAQFAWPSPPSYPTGAPPNGWLSGPGGLTDLACRFGTAELWVRDHLRQPNAPFCHTGNSGGAGGAAYLLAHYGFDSYYTFVEMTSGPPFVRIDHGCVCSLNTSYNTVCGQGSLSECYQSDGQAFIDPAYDPFGTACSTDINTGSNANEQMFIDDSIATTNAQYDFPSVKMHFLFGGQDTGSAEPQAMRWHDQISSKNASTGQIPIDCVADAPHPIPDVLDGAQTIANDIIANCNSN
jgi:hypothetical protein